MIWHIFLRWLARNLVAGWLHWTASLMERTTLYSPGILSFVIDLPLLHIMLLTKLSCFGLLECLTHHYSTLHSVASDQETDFTVREVQSCAHIHGIHWSYLFSIILKQVAWQNNGRAFWRHNCRVNLLAAVWKVVSQCSSEGSACFELSSNKLYDSPPNTEIQESRNQWAQNGMIQENLSFLFPWP